MKTRLVGVVGAILKGTARESTQRAAIQALGAMADPDGFPFVQPFLVQPELEKRPPLIVDAIEAASKLKSDESVPVLMGVAQNSKELRVAAEAVRAFERASGHQWIDRCEPSHCSSVEPPRDTKAARPRTPSG